MKKAKHHNPRTLHLKVIIKKTVTQIGYRPFDVFVSIDFRYEKVLVRNISTFQLVETVKFFAVGCS